MHRYKITGWEGDQYFIDADQVEATDTWVKFYKNDSIARSGFPTIVAMISAKVINNVQLADAQSGKADKIVPTN